MMQPRRQILCAGLWLGAVFCLPLSAGAAAMDDPEAVAGMEFEDLLRQRWFDIEVVVFERLRVLDVTTDETLALQRPRRWPANLLQLRNPYQEEDARDISSMPYEAPPPDQLRPRLDSVFRQPPAFLQLREDICLGYPVLAVEDPPHPSREAVFGDELDLSLDEQAADEPLTDMEADPQPAAEQAADPSDDAAAPPYEADAELSVAPPPTATELFLQAVAEFEDTLAASSFVPLADLTLVNDVKALNRRRHLRPLLHTRWRQPVPPRDAPQPVYLALEPGLDTPATRQGLPMLEGYLALTVSRYLHVNMRLWYHADTLGMSPLPFPVELLPGTRQTLPYMELNERRRMRSEELHYLDHPKLGVLIRVTPVAAPEALLDQQQALAAGADELLQNP